MALSGIVTDSDAPQYVLTITTVAHAVRALQAVKVHESFVAYLHLRHVAARTGHTAGLNPDWNGEVREWLEVSGGPPRKPHFRPLASRSRDAATYWMNPNLAGSYAKSSLRDDMRALLVGPDGSFQVPVDAAGDYNPAPVASAMLPDGEVIPMWALGAFLYRERAFVGPSEPPDIGAVNDVFRSEFEWTDREVEALFDTSLPNLDHPAFETWTPEAEAS